MSTPTQKGIPPFIFMLGFIVFAAVFANIGMVIRSTVVKADVVREDYYAQGLKHDVLLDAQRRLDSLGYSVGLQIQHGIVSVHWNASDSAAMASDFISRLQCISHFYRPDNSQLDQQIPMSRDSLGLVKWFGESKALKPGPWKVSVRWYLDTLLVLEKPFKYSS